MARKNILRHEIASGQSLSASFTSQPTIIKFTDNISYQINIQTVDSQGIFTVQGSNDYEINEPGSQVINPGNWVDLTLSGVPSVAAANDEILISMNQVPFNALRIKYTSTVAGTGTCDMWIMTKQVGG